MDENYKETNRNAFRRLLAVVLIVGLWIMWYATIGILSALDAEVSFFWRAFAIYPFTLVNIKASGLVWRHYN